MKSVLISIQPYWVFLIIAQKMGWNIDKEKTIEVRKSYPKDENWDKVAKIYCSKNKESFAKIPKEYHPIMECFLGKVIGEFVCDRIDYIGWISNPTKLDWKNYYDKKSCLTSSQLYDYSNGGCYYEWHISDLVIYDEPRELSGFYHYCGDDPKCDGCEAHYFSNTECGKEDYCCSVVDGCKPLKRPFQSWGYVYEADT